MPHLTSQPDPGTASKTSRRATLAAGAWSVPVIAATATAPEAAATVPCVPLPNNVTVTASPIARTPAGWSLPTYPLMAGRVDDRGSTADVLSGFTFTNSGSVTVAANTMFAFVYANSHPGQAAPGTSSPYSSLSFEGGVPAGWVLESSEIAEGPSGLSNTIRYYRHTLKYTLPLAPLASAPVINLRSVATMPRPTAASYGTNLAQAPAPAETVYSNRVFAQAGILTCGATEWGPLRSDVAWGVRIIRP